MLWSQSMERKDGQEGGVNCWSLEGVVLQNFDLVSVDIHQSRSRFTPIC
jgi:hypothetical protein